MNNAMHTGPVYQPPSIAPVADDADRPLWSVMIPAYNCAYYLRQTLESVLAQAPGPDKMQIEVVDDCSTKDDPESVVKEVGQGRVDFYRQPQNVGVNGNFNTCLRRSRGQLIHILHGDDYVLPNFYNRVAEVAEKHPQLSGFFVRAFIVDEENEIERLTPRMEWMQSGTHDLNSLLYHNHIMTPSAVIRRSFYEQHGGFVHEFIHVADWEMWTRCTSLGGAIAINEALACYRSFSANDSSRLARTSENLRDCMRLADYFLQKYPGFKYHRFRHIISTNAYGQTRRFSKRGETEAAALNRQFWREVTPAHRQIIIQIRDAVRNVRRTLSGSRKTKGDVR